MPVDFINLDEKSSNLMTMTFVKSLWSAKIKLGLWEKTHMQDIGLKNLWKIYRPAYGFLLPWDFHFWKKQAVEMYVYVSRILPWCLTHFRIFRLLFLQKKQAAEMYVYVSRILPCCFTHFRLHIPSVPASELRRGISARIIYEKHQPTLIGSR